MWTCDIIKAMQKIEERMGYPICIKSIRPLVYAPSTLAIETTGGYTYFYDITLGQLIGEE